MKKFPLIILTPVPTLGIRNKYKNCTVTISRLVMEKPTEILRNTLLLNLQAIQ